MWQLMCHRNWKKRRCSFFIVSVSHASKMALLSDIMLQLGGRHWKKLFLGGAADFFRSFVVAHKFLVSSTVFLTMWLKQR